MGAFSFCFALFVLIPALEAQGLFPRPPPLPPRPPLLPKPPGQLSPSGNVPGNAGRPLSGGSANLQATRRPSGSGSPSGNSGGGIKTSSGGRSMSDEIEDVIESQNSQNSGGDEMKLSSLLVALMMWLTHALGWWSL